PRRRPAPEGTAGGFGGAALLSAPRPPLDRGMKPLLSARIVFLRDPIESGDAPVRGRVGADLQPRRAQVPVDVELVDAAARAAGEPHELLAHGTVAPHRAEGVVVPVLQVR